ncbi:selenocysteine-specific translation elongation factor [bacterium]|nr:selenocysteine-specific translation elongation factor [bacterium]
MIVATAGHVDHGKTSLIKQLTGVDTDRLEEEKRRGLSINLGFAYCKIDDQTSIGFIDVPGHKSFINTMISGISGIDIAMLVIAADDGLMPQTLEHLQVMRMLGVKQIVVVITKIDAVDRGPIEALRCSALELLPQSRIFEVSNKAQGSPSGIKALQEYLENQVKLLKPRNAQGLFRMSIDRAFTLKGIGLLVTGTVAAGTVKVGDSLRLLSAASGRSSTVRVRSLNADNQPAEAGMAGQRCSFNIVGDFDSQSLRRGDYLSATNCIEPSDRFDTRIEVAADIRFPIKHMMPVKIYLGARRVSGKIFIPKTDLMSGPSGGRKLIAADNALVQLVLQQALVVCHGDRFLIRDDSESINLGGGTVLLPQAPPWHKRQLSRLDYLEAMEQDDPLQALLNIVVKSQQPFDFSGFILSWNMTKKQSETYLLDPQLQQCAETIELDGRKYLVPKQSLEQTQRELCQHLQSLHYDRPMEAGVLEVDLVAQFKTDSDLLFRLALSELLKEARVSTNNGRLSLAGHRPTLSSQVQQRWFLFSNILRKGGFQVPLLSEIEKQTGLTTKQLSALIIPALKSGDLIQLSQKRYMLAETRDAIETVIIALAKDCECFTVIDAKGQLGLGRGLTIEILEYLDSIHVTRRQGDGRALCF